MKQVNLVIKRFSGYQAYEPIWAQMRDFTLERSNATLPEPDQIWFLEHAPVFTQGQAGKPEHILSNKQNIPLVQSDRGGQITYHGPGQLMIYLLLNLKQYGFHAKSYVHFLEQSIITLLKKHQISAFAKPDAPGVYVQLPNETQIKKIASIGIRIRKNCSYHGICLNVDGDLSPFQDINPCGYQNLGMANISDFAQAKSLSMADIIQDFTHYFQHTLGEYQESLEHVR